MKYLYKTGVLLVGFFLAGSVYGCSFTDDADRMQPMETNFDNARYQTVILGTVIEKRERDLPEGPVYTIEIAETYRGDVSGTIEVATAGHSCGSYYDKGVTMVWFFEDETVYVDEVNPQYRFNSVAEARSVVANIEMESSAEAPADTCKVWFDGCNICTRDVPGGSMACTERACLVQEPASCQEYFSADDGIPYVDGPDSQPGSDFSGPSTQPPYSDEEIVEKEQAPRWWERFLRWMKGLFN